MGWGSRAADWANLIPQLVDGGHRVYALDLLGYGMSAQPRDAAYSISQQAAMVEGFLNSQHLQQVDLAGWSMGGWIAMRVALQQPQRVRRLVLLDSAGLRFKLGFDPSSFNRPRLRILRPWRSCWSRTRGRCLAFWPWRCCAKATTWGGWCDAVCNP